MWQPGEGKNCTAWPQEPQASLFQESRPDRGSLPCSSIRFHTVDQQMPLLWELSGLCPLHTHSVCPSPKCSSSSPSSSLTVVPISVPDDWQLCLCPSTCSDQEPRSHPQLPFACYLPSIKFYWLYLSNIQTDHFSPQPKTTSLAWITINSLNMSLLLPLPQKHLSQDFTSLY